MTALHVLECGPAVTVQDAGRVGYLGQGVSRSGAADVLALAEGAALIGQGCDVAALEMAGFGGRFMAEGPLRFALTGAQMRADVDGMALAWNAVHRLETGQVLTIGAATVGVFGYLHVGGGVDTPKVLGSRATHLAAGFGQRLEAGQTLALGRDTQPDRLGLMLDGDARFEGGTLRYVDSPQSDLFAEAERIRFQSEVFTRDARSNRQGLRLNRPSQGYASQAGLSILSDMISPGDIQMTGDGAPYILMADCQTIGGYPRIGTVLPCDMPRAAQAAAGAALSFQRIELAEAAGLHLTWLATLRDLPKRVKPRLRDPHDIADLASYQLISGATSGDTEQEEP